MKAYVNTEYGPSSVMQLQEVEKPTPGSQEILVKVKATSVNPADWHMMRGEPIVARASFGWSKPNYKILGHDYAGVVEALGEEVTDFDVGDEVYGEIEQGAFGQFLIVDQSKTALMPKSASFVEAAAIPVAALTALQGLVDQGKMQSGMKVLINGASGGVGTYAVQIAKAFGAHVTAVCSTGKIEQTYELGADVVVDYTKKDFSESPSAYDIILDVAGTAQAYKLRNSLSEKGICVLTGMSTFGHLIRTALLGPLGTMFSQKKFKMFVADCNKQDLVTLAALYDQGKIKSVIDQVYPFSELRDAVTYQEEGHSKGKVVVKVE
jgi:NADPH:quinone reductase-like Zn-dependent oxidoreductase